MRAICLVLALITLTARADTLQRDEAHGHHALGKVEFSRGNYRQALTEFTRAYELAPIPELLYSIARCHDLLGEIEPAIARYEQYLAAQPNAEDRAAVEAQIETLKRKRAPAPSPEPAQVTPAVPTPATTPVLVAPPEHREKPSRRRLGIGLGVAAGIVVVGAVVIGVLLRPTSADPYSGNFHPGVAAITP